MSSFISGSGPSDCEWDHFKETIRFLYLTENRKLEGLGGVRNEMEERHQFFARQETIQSKLYCTSLNKC